jgi:putative SOS response-associated peptidase YedK
MERRAEKYYNHYKDSFAPDWSKQQLQIFDSLPDYYFVSGFTHPSLPVLKHDGVFLYQWGLIPGWVKDKKQAGELRTKTLNAVGETAFEKPSFRKSIASKRCLLAVNGFYEWRDVGGVKYPYYIRPKEEEFFSLGCIYDSWVDRSTGEILDTFSIVTTPANPMMEKIHNLKKRMPLIIPRSREKEWIDPALAAEDVRQIIVPYDENRMTAYTVSRDLNSARNHRNTPAAIVTVEYPELELTRENALRPRG